MTESFCYMVEDYMRDHRMSEPPKDLRVLLEIDWNNNEPYLAGGERFCTIRGAIRIALCARASGGVSYPTDLMAFRILQMTFPPMVEIGIDYIL